MTELSHFSVIVPVYNGEETLDECLTSLVNQDYPRDKYEIVVINDGSTDGTAQIAARYAVRLISLETNKGRIVARNSGAEAAEYETLVFHDARVTSESQLLAKISKLNYQPLIPNVIDYNGSQWGFSRLFYLLRCKFYAPYYPLAAYAGEFQITPENFDRMPKGTGLIVCDRALWFACQPKARDKNTNDDTRILRKVVDHTPILRATSVTARYRQRTEPKQVFVHIFERGPRFSDYYLRPGRRYFVPYLLIWLVLLLAALATVMDLYRSIACLGLVVASGICLAAKYFSRRPSDLIVVCLYFPLIAVAFGLGILKWQLGNLPWLHRNRKG